MNAARKPSSPRGSQEKEAAPVSIDYAHLGRLAARNWKWLAGGVLIGAVIGLVCALAQTPIYSAKSTILVPAKEQGIATADVGHTDDTSADMLKTFEQLLQTRDLPLRVVKAHHLNEDPEFLPPHVVPPVSEDTAAGMLSNMIASIRIRPTTRLIDITVEHRVPKMAQLLANSLAQESILQELDTSARSSSVLVDYLQKEVDRLQQKVSESDQAIEDMRSKNHDLPANPTDDLIDLRLKQLNQNYISAQAQVTLLKERYGENHPKLIQAENEAEEYRKELNKAQEEALSVGSKSIPYNQLKSVDDSYKLQLTNMLRALNEAHEAVNISDPGIRVADEAGLPGAPVRPSKTKLVGIGGLAGALCGLVYIFALYFIDSSLRTVGQAESALGLPVLAAVPILTESDGSSVLPTFSDPQSFVAEAFRGLRASLFLHDREQPVRTILVASAVPGEGKSFSAANLAVALAQAGLSTLLVDADLRLPTTHTYFNLPPGEESTGFLDVLSGRSTLPNAIIKSAIPTLSLLLTTTPAESPAELLSGPRLPFLLDEAAQKFDRIVIDTAPLNAVSDTMLIMPKADAVLLVVRAGQTPVSESKSALDKIATSKTRALGLILNYLPTHALKSYAYGYSYGQKPKEKHAK